MKVQQCCFVRDTSGGEWYVKITFDTPLQFSSGMTPEITSLGRRVMRLMPKLKASQGVSLIGSTATIFKCKETPDQLVKVFEGPYVWNSTFKLHRASNTVVMHGSLPFIVGDIVQIDTINGVASVGWKGDDQNVIEIKLDKEADPKNIIKAINTWMKL